MLAAHMMSHGAQAICYFIALLAAVIAAIVAWVIAPRMIWATAIAVVLVMFSLVAFWNQLAAS